MGHDERKHALLSASGAHRWLYCTPSARLEEHEPDTTSESAVEGTTAHELAELKLRHYFHPVDFGKTKFTREVNKLKKLESWRDEMQGHTDTYLDYVKSVAMQFASSPSVGIEKRVFFGSYTLADPEDDTEGYGIADCILIGGGTIHVIDFKYGQSPNGRVSAEGNPQLSLYALGAYETYKLLYPITKVRLHVVQPRLSDGISEWECSIEELLAFGSYVKTKAELALKGEGNFFSSEGTCKFCKVKGRCRERAEKNVALAFAAGKLPPLISNEEMGRYLKQGTDVAKWLSDLQDCALRECLAGKTVPGWKAVEGRGSRDWTDMDTAFARLTQNGISEVVLWERKPLTLAQVEKIVGKKDFDTYVGDMVIKSPGKPTLAKESDNRKAITNKISATEAFGGGEDKHE